MPLGSEFWAAIVGAVVGSLTSAVPAWLLARNAARTTLARDLDDRKRTDHLAGTRLFLTLSKVGNDIFSSRLQIDDMMAPRPIEDGEETPYQRRLSVLSGAPLEPHDPFEKCDLAILANKDGIELLNALEHLGRCYHSQIGIFADYRMAKESAFEVYEQAEKQELTEDGMNTFQLKAQLAQMLKVREAKAEVLARGCVESVRENSLHVIRASRLYDKLVQGSLKQLDLPRMNLDRIHEKFPDLGVADQSAG